jgi:hypothetical protein
MARAARERVKRILWTCLILLAPACDHTGYHKDRSFKGIHIFGIGWLMEKSGTNRIRAFAIGSLDATAMHAETQTNAPYSFIRSTNGPTVITNTPP